MMRDHARRTGDTMSRVIITLLLLREVQPPAVEPLSAQSPAADSRSIGSSLFQTHPGNITRLEMRACPPVAAA
jgi:hypothetical protein